MRRFSLVVFDMDGVLVDSTPCHARAYQELWAHLGVDGPPYQAIAGRATDSVVAEYAAPLAPTEAQLQEWVRLKQTAARRCLGSGLAPFPDAAAAVGRLHARGIPLALGTGASRATTALIMAGIGLQPFFPVVVTSEDVVRGKPAPDIFTAAIRQSAGIPEKTLIIEDSQAGLRAAIDAGAWTASVRSGERVDHPRFAGEWPDLGRLLDELGFPA